MALPTTIRHRDSGMLKNRASSSSLRPASSLSNAAGYHSQLQQMSNAATESKNSADLTSVQVIVRIRPLTSHDETAIPARWQRTVVNAMGPNAVQVDASGQPPPGGTALPAGAAKRPAFTFDRVLTPDDGQDRVFASSVSSLIDRFIEGYNVTILAYGQTSSGKSYTMGTALADDDFEGLVDGEDAHPNTGIIPRAVARIFAEIKQNESRNANTQYTAKASFIEIYNEELIDLLADGTDNRPLVQIREDKAGHIIWSGLKEVRVQTVPDVMNHLLQGSAVRRTNETNMNAQSSRSHAIFSLTLTQRRYTGSGLAPPATPGSIRPPSAFGAAANRTSMLPRSTTPTGRSTPTNRASGLPRPQSRVMSPTRSATPTQAFGLATPGRSEVKETGEWVTVTSKFHFVDLAGSERLKRTAAQGERVKEGISINAGLHALGNVISALGDPAKSRRTTHIPYRDSKLTRLLQDSLGGNAHTLMIACVSPTEYNVNETVNTLQYANRARNIKNKAELNEVEVGWDDVEYLQTQVLKLRKELQILKGFRSGTAGSEAAWRAMDQKDVLEWQSKYAALSQRYSQMTAEVTRLQQQATKESMSNESYLKAAEPIIIEYEKTVDALEGQINLMKAALGHSEDVIIAHEQAAHEREATMAAMERDLETREKTVSELQVRITKLEDREATAERYARDMEVRLASFATAGDADAQTVNELKRDLGKHRETEGTREQYIKELESRLATAEQNVAPLHASVLQAEQELQRREEAYKDLHQRLEMLDGTADNKALLDELEERDKKLVQLESKLSGLQIERDEAVRERGKLTDAAASHQLERGRLEDQLRELKSAAFSAKPISIASKDAVRPKGDASEEDWAFLQTQVEMLTEELKSNQEASAKVQADLLSTETKYKQALQEMDDLNRQLSETKLEISPSTSEKENLTPSQLSRRPSLQLNNGRKTRPESLLLENSPGRRKSLTRRTSSSFLGYNPRETTPRDGSQTPRSAAAAPAVPQSGGSTDGQDQSPNLFRTRSLSQSLGQGSQSGGRRHLSLSGSADFAKLGWDPSQGSRDTSPAPSPIDLERKVRSLEAETMRLQEILRERDEEIAALEHGSAVSNGNVRPVISDKGAKLPATENGVRASKSSLSFPSATLEKGAGGMDELSSGNVDELMRALARKEQDAKRQVEQLQKQVGDQERERVALTSMHASQNANLMVEMEGMRKREVELLAELEALQRGADTEASANEERQRAAVEQLKAEHVENLAVSSQQHEVLTADAVDKSLRQQRCEHEAVIAALEEKHVGAMSALQNLHTESVKEAVEKVYAEQSKAMSETEEQTSKRHLDMQIALTKQHEAELQALRDQHVDLLAQKETAWMAERETEHSALVGGHEAALADVQAKHDGQLTVLKEEQRDRGLSDLQSQEARIVELQSQHTVKLKELMEQHERALASSTASAADRLELLKKEHGKSLEETQQQHITAIGAVEEELKQLKEAHRSLTVAQDSERLNSKRDLDTLQQNHVHVLEQIETLKTEHSERLRETVQEHSRRVSQIEQNLKDAIAEREALSSSHADLQRQYTDLREQDPNDVVSLRAELAETSDSLVTIEEALTRMQAERDDLQHQLKDMQNGATQANQARQVTQAQREVELLQANLANVRSELQRSKSDIQGMLEEKTRQDSLLREVQIKLTIAETRSASTNRSRDGLISPSPSSDRVFSTEGGVLPRSPASLTRRESSEQDGGLRSGRLGAPSSKPPPLTPPPNVPPPPTPGSSANGATTPTQRNSLVRSSLSSSSLQLAAATNGLYRGESPSPGGLLSRSSSSTSINSPGHLGNTSGASDAKSVRLIADQADEIEKLTRQLNHCEQDLQANIDLVATLEAALNDSERNLRKSRVQLSEATRERERYASQCDDLRQQVDQAQREMERERNSGQIERQGWENRIQQEREAKDRARRALEARLDDVQKKKNGKLFCI